MRPCRPSVPLAALGAAALLLSACGSSSGSKSSTPPTDARSGSSPSTAPPTSAAPSTTASSAATGSAPTEAQLQKIVLQAADLPASFKGTKAEPDTGDDLKTRLETCTGIPGAPDSHKVHTVESDDFQGGEVTVSSEFSSYQSASDVAADVAQLKSPKVNDCLNAALKTSIAKSAGAGTTVDAASVKLTPGSNGGPSNVAALASGVVSITVNGQKADIYLGVAFLTGPQLDGTLTFIGIGSPLDTTTQMSVLTAVAMRAQNP